METILYHRYLGECKLIKADRTSAAIIEHDGKEIEVSKSLLSFSPFLDYEKPSLCLIIDGGRLQDALGNSSFIDISCLDLDGKSTTQKEELFQQAIAKYKHKINVENSI